MKKVVLWNILGSSAWFLPLDHWRYKLYYITPGEWEDQSTIISVNMQFEEKKKAAVWSLTPILCHVFALSLWHLCLSKLSAGTESNDFYFCASSTYIFWLVYFITTLINIISFLPQTLTVSDGGELCINNIFLMNDMFLPPLYFFKGIGGELCFHPHGYQTSLKQSYI